MKLDPSTVGERTESFTFEYDFQRVILYALGVGATRDELDYLYEGRGPRVLPSFAVVPAYAPVMRLLERTGCDMTRLVHGSQSFRLHRPLPPQGRLQTVGVVSGIYDLKRLAEVVVSTQTTEGGEALCETEWSLLIRDAGGFGGPRPPKSARRRPPEGASPAFETALATTPEQALLYRLSGDLNPLHADPAFARDVGFDQGPILHGLCTLGLVTRAVLRHAERRASGIRALGGQFRKPVWPGEPITTRGYDLGDRCYALEALAADRPEPVITNGWAELTP